MHENPIFVIQNLCIGKYAAKHHYLMKVQRRICSAITSFILGVIEEIV